MIELTHLSKQFDSTRAVDDISLTIETGEFFGLLGSNGAGKTTTIRMLSTLLPTAGEIRIDGELLTRSRGDLKRKIGMITQEYSMRQDMTMDEIMEYQGRLYYMNRKQIREKTEELLALLFCMIQPVFALALEDGEDCVAVDLTGGGILNLFVKKRYES